VPTIDGTSELVVPPLTLSGEVLRMSGKGVQNARSGHRGSQLVTVRWVLAETGYQKGWATSSLADRQEACDHSCLRLGSSTNFEAVYPSAQLTSHDACCWPFCPLVARQCRRVTSLRTTPILVMIAHIEQTSLITTRHQLALFACVPVNAVHAYYWCCCYWVLQGHQADEADCQTAAAVERVCSRGWGLRAIDMCS